MASTRRTSTQHASQPALRRAKRSGAAARLATSTTSKDSTSAHLNPDPHPAMDWAERYEANRLALLKLEQPQREASARSEANMIARALAGLPLESREDIGKGEYPANHLASTDRTQSVIHKIMRRRLPGNEWFRVHNALAAMEESNDYNAFIDGLRDVAFLVGLDYGRRALPAWWADYEALGAETRDSVGDYVRSAVRYTAKAVRGEA